MAFLTAMANSFGARWFDEKWKPQFDQPDGRRRSTSYVDLMKDDGPPGASSNGFNENLALFDAGKCGMWIDATVAAAFVTNPKESKVADKVGFALAPNKGLGKNANWLWAWSLAIPAGSKKADAAEKFVAWATTKDYIELVAGRKAGPTCRPGTRNSLYENPDYQKAAPFAKLTLDVDRRRRSDQADRKPVPYVGVQFVAIPEFQGIGTTVGQHFSAALAGSIDGRCRARRRAVGDRARDEAGRLYQVARRTHCLSSARGRPAPASPDRTASLS